MAKAGGYVFSLLGVLLLALSVDSINKIAITYVPLLAGIQSMYLMIAGIVLVILGIVMLKGSSHGKTMQEVPIYHGNKVVGYRRH